MGQKRALHLELLLLVHSVFGGSLGCCCAGLYAPTCYGSTFYAESPQHTRAQCTAPVPFRLAWRPRLMPWLNLR